MSYPKAGDRVTLTNPGGLYFIDTASQKLVRAPIGRISFDVVEDYSQRGCFGVGRYVGPDLDGNQIDVRLEFSWPLPMTDAVCVAGGAKVDR